MDNLEITQEIANLKSQIYLLQRDIEKIKLGEFKISSQSLSYCNDGQGDIITCRQNDLYITDISPSSFKVRRSPNGSVIYEEEPSSGNFGFDFKCFNAGNGNVNLTYRSGRHGDFGRAIRVTNVNSIPSSRRKLGRNSSCIYWRLEQHSNPNQIEYYDPLQHSSRAYFVFSEAESKWYEVGDWL